MRSWRNWQTRKLEVLVPETVWRFKSSRPHHRISSSWAGSIIPAHRFFSIVLAFSYPAFKPAPRFDGRGTHTLSGTGPPCGTPITTAHVASILAQSADPHSGKQPLKPQLYIYRILNLSV